MNLSKIQQFLSIVQKRAHIFQFHRNAKHKMVLSLTRAEMPTGVTDLLFR